MKKLIDDIKQRLVSLATAARYIDEDWGQLDYYSASPPAKWPCILVDIGQIPWSNQGELVQTGLGTITVRVADLRLSNSNVKAPEAQRQKAAGILDLLERINAGLHGWTADTANGPLTRLSTSRLKRDDGIREYEMVYQVQLIDDSAKRHYDTFHVDRTNIEIRMSVKAAPVPGE